MSGTTVETTWMLGIIAFMVLLGVSALVGAVVKGRREFKASKK